MRAGFQKTGDGYRQLSWRDPDGHVVEHDGRIFRAVAVSAVARVEGLLESPWFQAWVEKKAIPSTRWLSDGEAPMSVESGFRWLEHERLSFPCYPHELTALQLYDSAKLTIELAADAYAHGWELKDASAWNVLFSEGRPVFCDILSFVPSEVSPVWTAYGQFQRHYTIPLLLHRHLGLSPAMFFLSQRDGIDPAQARSMITGLRAWRQPALEAITMPALLAPKGRDRGHAAPGGNPAIGRHVVALTLRRLSRHLDSIRPAAGKAVSKWSQYTTDRTHYTVDAIGAKRDFVRRALKSEGIATVLDLGCNTGEFSLIAEAGGKRVVAADNDWHSLETLYSDVRGRNSSIQPLYIDLGRPTPAVGWDNREVAGVLSRLKGQFDCILALGLIHHLLVSERVVLADLCRMLFWLEPKFILVEWVDPVDPRFCELAGRNEHLYGALSLPYFESVLSEYFHIRRAESLPTVSRTLLWCERKGDQD